MAFVVMLVVAAATYFFLLPGPIVVLAALLLAFVLAGVVLFGRASVPLRIAYGVVDGILVGGVLWISWGFGFGPVQLVGLGILTLLAVAGLLLPGGSKGR
jgi:hypothetical protein